MRPNMRYVLLGSVIVLVMPMPVLAQTDEPPKQFPYVGADAHVIEVGIAFDEAAVRALLPPGLEPADGFTGGVDIYNVGYGWGVGAYSAGYVWLDLAGDPGPTGAPRRYMVRGYYSHLFYPFDVLVQGSSTLEETDGNFIGAAGPDGSTVLSVTLKGDSTKCTPGVAGMDDYVWGHEPGA